MLHQTKMEGSALIVLPLTLVSLLVSSTSALECHRCYWVEGQYEPEQTRCITGDPVRGEEIALPAINATEGVIYVEACAIVFGGFYKTGKFIFVRTQYSIPYSYVGKCQKDTYNLTVCACTTDFCNSFLPEGILKCHLCIQSTEINNPGCISGTSTQVTYARSGEQMNEGHPLIVAGAAAAAKYSHGRRSRRAADEVNDYQECFSFGGTKDGQPYYIRAKLYAPRVSNGCIKTKPGDNFQGEFCFCLTDLCNSASLSPGTGSGGGGNSRNAQFLNFSVLVMGLIIVLS